MTTPAYEDTNIFAKILRGELPGEKVYEDNDTIVIMDIMPRGDGHCLVIPKAPSRNILDVSPESLAAVAATTQKMARTVIKAFEADGVTIQQFSQCSENSRGAFLGSKTTQEYPTIGIADPAMVLRQSWCLKR